MNNNMMDFVYPFVFFDSFAGFWEQEADKHTDEITWCQYQVLLLIDHYRRYKFASTDNLVREDKAYPTLTILAEELMTPHQNVKRIISILERKGMVEVYDDDDDRKKQRIRILDRGRECLTHQKRIDELIKLARKGITDEQLSAAVDTLSQISRNIQSIIGEIEVPTCDNVRTIKANYFKKSKVIPKNKNRPRFQLYASKGALLEISGYNRFIVGFYMNESDIDKEIEELNQAIVRGESSYKPHYNCDVSFDSMGMPVLKNKTL